MGQILPSPIESEAIQRKGNEHYTVASLEMQGFRISMEDTHIISFGLSDEHPDKSLFGIFDGHSGDKASLFIKQNLRSHLGELDDPTCQDELQQAMMDFDQEFLERRGERGNGSTCVFVIAQPVKTSDTSHGKDASGEYELTVVNIGDSRAILIKSDGTCVSMTKDHKPSDPEESRRIYAANGSVRSNRVDGGLALSRAIGDWPYKSNTKLPIHEQKVIAWPDIKKFKASRDDILLICCDGLVEAMTNEEIAQVVHKKIEEFKNDPAELLSLLTKLSLKKGSTDNHSTLMILFRDGTHYARDDEFRPGPYTMRQDDEKFKEYYLADAKKHGYEGETLMALIKKTEDSMRSKEAINTEDTMNVATEETMEKPTEGRILPAGKDNAG